MRTRLVLAASALLAAACGESSSSPAWFREEAQARGLVFAQRSGHDAEYWMPEIMGGGAALFDMEDDGDLDAYLVQSGDLHPEASDAVRANALFANDGRGHFQDVSAGSGAEDPRYGMGVACGDADGDGDTDLFVTNVGRDTLLVNQASARFADETVARGLEHQGWSTSACFFDADRDGDLDLFIARYLEWSRAGELTCMDALGRPDYCSPKNYKTPARDFLYRNEGGGRFLDVSRASGVWSEPGTGLGVAAGDLDGDGWQDVFVANDGMPNHLWQNQRDGRFANVAMLSGCGTDANGLPKAGMGVLLSDLDDDLDLDVLVCNLRGESDSFYRNDGGYFSDRTAAVALGAVTKPFTRFGLALGDFDQDGRRDLYLANGRVERPAGDAPSDPYAEPNLVLRGLDGGAFAEVKPRGGTRELALATSRAVAQGDVDGDGALDLLLVNRDGPAQLLMNTVAPRGNAVTLRVREKSGADALGAELVLELGSRRVRRDVGATFGYLSSHDPRVHVGLGTHTELAGVRVRWTDGVEERFGPFVAGSCRELRRGQGTPP
ncbi:MAG: CRTAC1 family protein [Planctomycetes bacterium]|nr:CRTAC1 family protein [Planctomycetota bacterium]